MKGAFFLGNREFEVRDMEKRPLAADEVRIRVMACGVCGTDVHIYHGEAGSAEVTPPVVLGHEYAGIVEEVGADVKGLAPGDHVAVDPNIYCGACTPCRDGKKQFCEHLQALGVTRDGGFAQYSAAPAAQCFKLAPEPVSYTHLCNFIYGRIVKYQHLLKSRFQNIAHLENEH